MISKKMGGLALAVIAAVALSSFVTTGANARVVAETKLTIARGLPLYHGKVKSDFPKCEKDRKVKLFRKRSGKDQLMGSDRSNNQGRWTVNIEQALDQGARYYAKTRAVEVSSSGTGLSCSGDSSRTRRFVAG